jgi:hypothetical protein
MRSIVVAAIWLIAIASPALAQSKVYIAGDVFADIKRLSGDPDTAVLNATAPGGGVRLGAFLSSLWSLELGVDLGAKSENVVKRTIDSVAFATIASGPAPSYDDRTSNRFSAASVLIGYHPPQRGRVGPGFRGGMTFMHVSRDFTSVSISTTFSSSPTVTVFNPIVPVISVITRQRTTVVNDLAATVAAEVAVAMTHRLAIVPEVRAHAGVGAIVVRAGIAGRWIF